MNEQPTGYIRTNQRLTNAQADALARLFESGADPQDLATLVNGEYVDLQPLLTPSETNR